MKNRTLALFVIIMLLSSAITLSMLTVKVFAVTYTTTYANTSDAPIFGTMIGPSNYYQSDHGSGAVAMPYGNALDDERVWINDAPPTFTMLKWDMGFSTNFIRVYPNVEHDGGFNWDYLQWSLWGSNTGAEDPNAWTLLWNPKSTSGSSVDDFVVISLDGIAPTTVYRYGSPMGPDNLADAFTMDFNLTTNYRYFGVRASTLAINAGSPDCEIDAIATRISVPLTVSINPLSSSISVGNSVTFTSTISGGVPPYSYQWYLNTNPVLGATSAGWTFTPTTSGIYYVFLNVTDSQSNTNQSETARIAAIPLPVGGYSVEFETHTVTSPYSPYYALSIVLAMILAMGLVISRRRTRRQHQSDGSPSKST
jgi:hypothetical protein